MKNSTKIPADLFDEELERAALSGMLQSSYTLPEAMRTLDADCFSEPKHREIFQAVSDLYEEGESIDIMIVHNRLRRKGSPVSSSDLCAITIDGPVAGLMTGHFTALKELSLRRRLWQSYLKLGEGILGGTRSVEEIQLTTREDLDTLFEGDRSSMTTFGEVFADLRAEIVERMQSPEGTIHGTPTGYRELDARGGLSAGDLIVIAAETSQGKTSFATSLALTAIGHGHGVAFYSMEMTSRQLVGRITAMKSGVKVSDLLNGRLTAEELGRVDSVLGSLPEDRLQFDEKSTATFASMAMSIRTMKLRHGIKGVVVDYLQLVDMRDPKINREQAVGQCARALKNLAKELGIWVVVISQLSRNPGQGNTLPTKSRLRDSGQIEEAADIVMLIHRPAAGMQYPEPFADVATEGTALVMVEKGRNIGTFRFICGFDPERTLFRPLEAGELERLREDPLERAYRRADEEDDPFGRARF